MQLPWKSRVGGAEIGHFPVFLLGKGLAFEPLCGWKAAGRKSSAEGGVPFPYGALGAAGTSGGAFEAQLLFKESCSF